MVNGPGVRYVLFLQGCPHHCRDCQNPETWAMDGGQLRQTDEVIAEMLSVRYLDGITLSGGDPLAQPRAAEAIARAARAAGLSIWCYTGWTFEEILAGEAPQGALEALAQMDVLVDGPFVSARRSEKVLWRGSDNQRLIDVQASLAQGKVVLLPESEQSRGE